MGADFTVIAASFDWVGPGRSFRWAHSDALREVHTYLDTYDGLHYWRVIERLSLRGYSLFLHEWVEIQFIRDQLVDELDCSSRAPHQDPGHARALLIEHRLLQAAARNEGLSFSLQELVENNPHGDEPCPGWKGDWDLLWRHLPDCIGPEDRIKDSSRVAAVKDFYRRHGFEKVQFDA
jgi:hypothetical protein